MQADIDTIRTVNSHVRPTTSQIGLADRWDHFLARWGVNRAGHRVEPGLYALGRPTSVSPVFVTANYTLSFDALRSALKGIDSYILVLDTQGINVWCAAGKGTFSTDEIAQRVEATGLREIVTHRVLILPQLGAPGVAAHEVRKRAGFAVEYGPVRAEDLPEYLVNHRTTPEMRQVRFSLWDRAVLIPVELVHVLLPAVLSAAVLFLAGGVLTSAAALAAILAGVVLFPLLLPYLPTREFSSKGFVLGAVTAIPFSLVALLTASQVSWWASAGWALTYLLAMPPVTAFLALNFTGSTPFTSRTGVRHEIFTYIPIMAGVFGTGVLLLLAMAALRWTGWR